MKNWVFSFLKKKIRKKEYYMKLLAACMIIVLLYLGALCVNNLTKEIDEHEDIMDSED